MKIDADPAIKNTQTNPARPRWVVILAALVALAVFAMAMIVLGMAIFRGMQPIDNPALGKVVMKSIPGRLCRAAKHHLSAFQNGESLPRLYLDIKFKHLEKLRAKRLEAIETGSLIARDGDFVPATIRYEERDVSTKVRLKGDALDHLFSDKWSFRVHTRKGDQLFGMRRFSIQSAGVRDHQAEPIFLAHLRREGVLTPRYQFVEVSVNGRDIGVMVIEEHFSKELLESQQRREGVILRFDEGPFWQNFNLNGAFGPYGNPRVAVFRPFGGGKVAASPNLSGDRDAATGLMRGFIEGKLPASQVFDLELMSRFVAVCEVWEAFHPLAWHNMRFYFNPLTARLEPIGFDGNLQGNRIGVALVAEKGDFVPLLLADDRFRTAFIRNLNRIAGEMATGDTLEWAKGIEAEVLPKIQEGVEDIPPIRWDRIEARAKHLSQISADNYPHFTWPLGHPEMDYPEPVTARVCQNCRDTQVELVNVLTVPVEVLGVEVKRRKDLSPEAAASLAAITTDPAAKGPFPAMVTSTPYLGDPTPT